MATDGLPLALPAGKFEGRQTFQQLVRLALSAAARDGWQELVLSDASFDDWPLGERAVVDSLNTWARAGRRFVLLATRFDGLQSTKPRFVAWRQTWGHIIDCRLCRPSESAELTSALWSPHWVMRRLNPVSCICVSGTEPERRVALREQLTEHMRHGRPAFPASVLGL